MQTHQKIRVFIEIFQVSGFGASGNQPKQHFLDVLCQILAKNLELLNDIRILKDFKGMRTFGLKRSKNGTKFFIPIHKLNKPPDY